MKYYKLIPFIISVIITVYITFFTHDITSFKYDSNFTKNNKIALPATIKSIDNKCSEVAGLPDPSCTPGITTNVSTYEVCNRTTKSIRPSSSYTNRLKIKQIKQYEYPDNNMKNYEEDHLISLELGGSPTDPKNLWPEPRKNIILATESAEEKDKTENLCHKMVCEGKISLFDAQKEISHDWETACR